MLSTLPCSKPMEHFGAPFLFIMNYTIYIDESMSINGIENTPDFSISLFIINETNFRCTKSKFKRAIVSYWKKHNLYKVELKAHYLKVHKDLDFLEKTLSDCLVNNKFVCSHISNRNIDQKWIKNKSATYNFMVKCAIERAYDNGYIEKGSKLLIQSDIRNISNDYKKSLEEYLIAELCLNKSLFSDIKQEYIDSKNHWGIQLADYLSFTNSRQIIQSKKSGNMKLGKDFRHIY